MCGLGSREIRPADMMMKLYLTDDTRPLERPILLQLGRQGTQQSISNFSQFLYLPKPQLSSISWTTSSINFLTLSCSFSTSSLCLFIASVTGQASNDIKQYLTIIARKRAWYRLILSRRGRRPSWLKLGDITQAWAL